MSAIEKTVTKIIESVRPHNVLTGIVTSVKDDYCAVKEDVSGRFFFKVAYTSLLKNKDSKLVLKPKKDSEVVFVVTQNNTEAYLVSVSELESVKGTIESVSFEMDSEGYKLERTGENLKDVLNDFIDEVNQIVVIQGNTINQAEVIKIKERLNKILK